jgi:glycerophosphoryl diester phosphodiesterase
MIRIIGHRGGRNLWAENSLGGFLKSATLGVHAVELDLHLTRDGEIVVIHDPLLERTTTAAARYRTTAARHSLDCGSRTRSRRRSRR